jgi:hypothetical protein
MELQYAISNGRYIRSRNRFFEVTKDRANKVRGIRDLGTSGKIFPRLFTTGA